MNYRVAVSSIIKKGDFYLFGKKAKGIGPYPDKWLIIGGGVNLGNESLEDALKREVMEEANINIKNIKKIGFAEDFCEKKGAMTHFIFLNFIADYEKGDEKPGDDIMELKWMHKDKIKDLDLCVPSIKLFKELGII